MNEGVRQKSYVDIHIEKNQFMRRSNSNFGKQDSSQIKNLNKNLNSNKFSQKKLSLVHEF